MSVLLFATAARIEYSVNVFINWTKTTIVASGNVTSKKKFLKQESCL